VVVYDYHCMILCGLRYGSASKSGRIGIRVARRRVYARADKLLAGHVESHAVGMDEGWRDRGACTYIGRVFADEKKVRISGRRFLARGACRTGGATAGGWAGGLRWWWWW
jgi:hypothetical protein